VAGVLIATLVRKVRQAHFTVLALTRLDALTGLWNRRAFDEDVADECVRKRRSGRPLRPACKIRAKPATSIKSY